MASTKNIAGADLAVDFNRVKLALAKRQSMLANLMGFSSAPKHPDSPVPEETSDDFVAEPELLGIGAKQRDDTEEVSHILSSEARLKRQLLPKDFGKRQTANQQQSNGRKNGSMAGKTSKGGTPLGEKIRREDPDSDDDAGRSSLGKRKRERTKQVDGNGDMGVDKKNKEARNVMGPEEKSASAPQVNKTSTDNTPSKDMDKKRRKKNKEKKKERKAQEDIPAS